MSFSAFFFRQRLCNGTDHPSVGYAGNVGRFMNHSCSGGNVLGRTVLVEGDTGLLYTIGMFTHRFVAAGTELTYDYQWDMKRLEVACSCGYKHCEGWKE